MQGTRTIIDNLDDGLSVTPILTNFENVIDCYESTVREEGPCGLYKGFGALVMQCLTYTSIIKLSKFLFTQVSILFFKKDSSSYPVIQTPHRQKVPPSPIATVVPPQQSDFRMKKPNKKKKSSVPVDYDFSSDSDGFENNRFLHNMKNNF